MTRQRGLTLIELLVSVTILALATIVAMTVYDHARRSFKTGENVTEQQQVVRNGLDIVATDIRMAGFNTNPDGNPVRPDEQIEAAYDTAITLRADFDAADPIDSTLPEQTLAGAGAAYLAVSTGNDEIVSYVLAKSDGSSPHTLSFGADVGDVVRNGTIEDVDIGDVDLTQSDPPYTLYKLELENDSTGCCGTSFARRQPVADNIRSLRFLYYDRAGNLIPAPGGAETPAAIVARSAIHRVAIELEALSRDSDPHWLDETDPDPDTRRFRKFDLSAEVTPPNLGRRAIKDLRADVTAPGAPQQPLLYAGHCGGLIVDWPQNPALDEVAYYRVNYGTSPATLTGVRSAKTPPVYVAGLNDATRYHVAIEAVDAAGNRSAPSILSDTLTTNPTLPKPVLTLTAFENPGQIDLAWLPTLENTTDTTGDPITPQIRDLAGYRLHRDDRTGFNPRGSNRLVDESVLLPLATPTFSDTTLPLCDRHYYKVRAVDTCGLPSDPSNEVSAIIQSTVDPLAPLDAQAFHSGPNQVTVKWSPVLENVDGDTIGIDTYKIYRTAFQPVGVGNPLFWSYYDQVSGATSYYDSVTIPAGQTVWYLIEAVDACAPPNDSVLSAGARPYCSFTGDVKIVDPIYAATVAGLTTIRVEVQGAPATASHTAQLTYTRQSDNATVGPDPIFGGTDWWVETWNASPGGIPSGFFVDGSYLITAEVEQTDGGTPCTAQATIRVEIDN